MSETKAAATNLTSHLDHTELLLLDGAVARVTESFVMTHKLTTSQRAILEEYGEDVKLLMPRLFGPARDFAEQIGELVRTVLASASGAREGVAKKFAAA
jgi:hypothetical protein